MKEQAQKIGLGLIGISTALSGATHDYGSEGMMYDAPDMSEHSHTIIVPTDSVKPGVEYGPIQTVSESDWEQKNAEERIQSIWHDKTPNVEGFEVKNQLLSALAEYYCQNVECSITPQELAASVTFIDDQDTYVRQGIASGNLVVGNPNQPFEEISKDFSRISAGFVDNKTKKVYFNESSLKEQSNPDNMPDYFKAAGKGMDMEHLITSYVLLHEFGHVFESDAMSKLAKPVIIPIGSQGSLSIESREGFRMTVRSSVLTGSVNANEPFVDFIGVGLNKQLGNPIVDYIGSYRDAVYYLSDFNKMLGIGVKEASEYLYGKKSFDELATRYGSLTFSKNPENGIAMITILGLLADGKINVNNAASLLQQTVYK